MSAAATAAGYLYASTRLRGRNKDAAEQDKPPARRRTIRFAALPEREHAVASPPRVKTVRVEYRTRRWKPEEAG